jgi:hypothetical protein
MRSSLAPIPRERNNDTAQLHSIAVSLELSALREGKRRCSAFLFHHCEEDSQNSRPTEKWSCRTG